MRTNKIFAYIACLACAMTVFFSFVSPENAKYVAISAFILACIVALGMERKK